MKILMLLFMVFCAGLSFPVQAKPSNAFGIAATVNKDAISEGDVNDRMKLIFASSGIADTKESRDKARPQALNILIEEQLKMQAAENNDLSVDDDEVKEAFSTMAAQNKMTADEFAKVMSKSGIPTYTLFRQIKAQIAWQKVVSTVLRPRIDVTEKDINAKLERLKENIGKTEYKVSEIFLPVESKKDEKNIKSLGQKLIEEIKKGRAPFSVVAAQFSKTASAAQGGSMGWVQEGDLPKDLEVVVRDLTKGQISSPVKGLSGYYILMLNDKREISADTLPEEEEILNSIGLQRLDRLQKRHLADLRSTSFIDRRDN